MVKGSKAGESELFRGSPVDLDLSDEGLAKMAAEQDGVTTESEEADVASAEADNEQAEESIEPTTDENSDEGEGSDDNDGEQESGKTEDDEPWYEPEGIKNREDAVKALKDNQRYIRDLETKNKKLLEAVKPLLKEGADGQMQVVLPAQQPDHPALKPEDIQLANQNFWKAMDDDAIGTLSRLFSNVQEKALAPYEAERRGRSVENNIDKMHSTNYSKYGDFRSDVRQVLSDNPHLESLGEQGVSLAFGQVFSRNLDAITKEAYDAGKTATEKTRKTTVAGAPSGAKGKAGQSEPPLTEEQKIIQAIFAQGKTGIPFLG